MAEAEKTDEERNLVLDELDERLDAFNAFRKSDSDKADEILRELGGADPVGRDIILQLAGKRPLGHPDKFLAAHVGAIRSLEVLDRNGARGVKTRIPGPLDPIANFLVQLVTRFIVSNHQKSLADNLRKLYARRQANCLPDDPSLRLLTRARRDADLVYEGFKKNPIGIPSVLIGVIVVGAGTVGNLLVASVQEPLNRVIASIALFLVLPSALAGASCSPPRSRSTRSTRRSVAVATRRATSRRPSPCSR